MFIILVAIIIGLVIRVTTPASSPILVIYTLVASAVVIFFLCVRRMSRCPKCKKPYAMNEINRTLNDIRDSSERVLKTYRDPKTGLNESYTDVVPAVILKYDVTEECCYCGYRRHKTVSRKEVSS